MKGLCVTAMPLTELGHMQTAPLRSVQVIALPHLADLRLIDSECQIEGNQNIVAPITTLKLTHCQQYMDLLMALPDLLQLEICDPDGYADIGAVCASLATQEHLTSLIFEHDDDLDMDAWLPHLTNLRHLSVYCPAHGNEDDFPVVGLPPPGPWCYGLHELGIAARVAFGSLETLRSMTALENLHLYCTPSDCSDSSTWDGLLEVARANIQLECLDIEYSGYDDIFVMGISLADSLLRLLRSRPSLAIATCHTYYFGDWD